MARYFQCLASPGDMLVVNLMLYYCEALFPSLVSYSVVPPWGALSTFMRPHFTGATAFGPYGGRAGHSEPLRPTRIRPLTAKPNSSPTAHKK